MKNIALFVIVILLGFFGYQYVKSNKSPTSALSSISTDAKTDNTSAINAPVFTEDELNDIPPTYNEYAPVTSVQTPVNFTCDGRQHCSQMTSCAEATYFVQHCPNTKMDGNNDGVPCEQQWCQ